MMPIDCNERLSLSRRRLARRFAGRCRVLNKACDGAETSKRKSIRASSSYSVSRRWIVSCGRSFFFFSFRKAENT